MRFVSLFAGIGGFDLGLERAGMTCVGQVEINPFCRAVLAKHWPDVPRFNDVREFNRSSIDGSVDLVCGGFPCQDISTAGKGAGLDGERSGLWWEMHRIIDEFRPEFVLAENVPALRSRGADDVISSLEALGYTVWTVVVGAWATGAPHERDRVWILAHRASGGQRTDGRSQGNAGHVDQCRGELCSTTNGLRNNSERICDHERSREERSPTFAERSCFGIGMADTVRIRQSESRHENEALGSQWDARRIASRNGAGPRWPSRPGEPQHDWEPPRLVNIREEVARMPQRSVGLMPDGLPARLVRLAGFHNRNTLRAAGNSVVPAVVEVIGQAIMKFKEIEL